MSLWVYFAIWGLGMLVCFSLCVAAARGDRQSVQSMPPRLKLVGDGADRPVMDTRQINRHYAEQLRAVQSSIEARLLAIAKLDAEIARLQAEDADRRRDAA